jgi:putative methionine-R-sulfoxide reductase with GAF domain
VALTEHLRISPGAGIIGAVYQKGVPLRVEDVTTLPGFERPRSRYRTKSFAAVR